MSVERIKMFRIEFDKAIETDDFIDILIFLIGVSIWKLAMFYPYTFFLGEKGKEYRQCMRYVLFPYYLKWKLYAMRFEKWLGGKNN